jgi:nucleoside 2-deoxyribosyltransferase
MPFSGQYDDTFLVAIQPAALAFKAVADRVDHTGHFGDIVQQIKDMIKVAKVVIADLSESKANVCYEVGYAEALNKPVVQICSTPIASIPFNLRNNQTVAYQIGQTSKLKTKLEKELAKVI